LSTEFKIRQGTSAYKLISFKDTKLVDMHLKLCTFAQITVQIHANFLRRKISYLCYVLNNNYILFKIPITKAYSAFGTRFIFYYRGFL